MLDCFYSFFFFRCIIQETSPKNHLENNEYQGYRWCGPFHLKKETISIHPPAGLITDITDLDEFKQRLGLRSRAKTLSDLINYLDTLPEQSWNVNKTFRSNSGKIRTVGIYDSFPTYEDATELFEQFGGGKYTILCISPRRMKVGYYEFEGEDRFPEEEEAPVRQKRLKLKYKPRDFKEALLLKRLE
ncbi:MAG: hypothetical protein IBX40_12635 [Methanosarcinales archaeon]|nr:hypothetical protein [Methanosarcinales archaeon]